MRREYENPSILRSFDPSIHGFLFFVFTFPHHNYFSRPKMKALNASSWPPITSEDALLQEPTSTAKEDLTNNAKRPRGTMRGQFLEVSLASCLLIMPMLGLSIALIGLVYTELMPDNRSTYSEGNRTDIPLGSSAYYISYSATRLAFIASASSTLATVLITPAMVLFSYLAAHYMAISSDAQHIRRLPSPYQLELLIRILDARFMAIWSFILYGLGLKKKRVRIIPELWRAASMMAILVLLV